MILGFDPGRDKCGIAVMDRGRSVLFHEVVPASEAINTVVSICQEFPLELIVMGDQTTSTQWKQQLSHCLNSISIVQVDERYSSLEARDRYWQLYPPQGLSRLIPQGMRVPPRPVDDIVAIILVERFLADSN